MHNTYTKMNLSTVKWAQWSRLGRGLYAYQVGSWCVQPFGHNRHWPKIGGSAPFWGRGAGSPSSI